MTAARSERDAPARTPATVMTTEDSAWPGPDQRLADFAARSRVRRRQNGLDAAAVEALGALAAQGIHPVLLKGAALARALYRDGEVRSYFDVDLLVDPADLDRLGPVLAGLGYTNMNELQGISEIGDALHAQVWSRTVEGFGNQTLDVHWRLDGTHAPPEVAWRALTRDRVPIDLGGQRLSTLALPGLALHLALHAAQHGPDDLKAMGDLNRGLERWPEDVWRQAAALAVELEALSVFAAGLGLTPPGQVMARRLGVPGAPDLTWSISNRPGRPRGTFHLEAFTEASGVGERLALLHRALFPPRNWIVWEHPAAERGWPWLVAGYARHILSAPAWALRAWRYRRRAEREGGL